MGPLGLRPLRMGEILDDGIKLGASAISGVATLIASLLVTAACTQAVSDVHLDQQTSVRSSLRFAVRRMLPLLVMLILYWLWLVAFFVRLIIPGVWLYTKLIGPGGSKLSRSQRIACSWLAVNRGGPPWPAPKAD